MSVKPPQKISADLEKNKAFMEKNMGMGTSFDVGFRELIILKRKVHIYYVTGLCDSSIIQQLLTKLVEINDVEEAGNKLTAIVENRLVHQQVGPVKTMDELSDQILSGLIGIVLDGEKFAYVVDVRSYPGRSPEEPDTEKVIRGSRDGFTENIIENTALTRRRIRDERLRNEMLKVGERSKTDVCISYLQDVADAGLIEAILQKLNSIEIDGVTMAEKTIEEFIIKQKWNIYPLVRYTERPDVAASHLLEGHVLLFVDTSPSAIIIPATFFHHMQHAEEYRQAPSIGTFVRLIRFLAVLAALFLLPLWLLFVMEPQILPKTFSFIGLNEEGNIPVTIQIILAMIGVEFLRMASIHTPTPLSTAMGLIAAVLIGQIAVDVGVFSPEVILYVSISTIGSYVTPSYELSVANKLISLVLIILVGIFGLKGFIAGFVIFVFFVANIKSLRTPYLWPFLPFNAQAMYHVLIRTPFPSMHKRLSIVHPKNVYRQPQKKG